MLRYEIKIMSRQRHQRRETDLVSANAF